MPEDTLHATVETLLVLLLIVFVVAIAVERVRLPYTIALVVVGLVGFKPGFLHATLTPDLILLVFLPVLLFEGAYNVPTTRLWKNIGPITLLAVPGVALGTVVTGAIIHLALALPWGVSLLFGALISSTDPIAVVSLFRQLSVPRRLSLLVEGESLFNDGAAITLFQIILAAIVTGSLGVAGGILRFVVTVAGALAVGAVVGYIGSRLLRTVEHTQIQITATVIAAYGAYLLAETFTFSGAIAVVVTALFFGNYGSTSGLRPQAVRAIGGTWEFLAFVANSLVFLLIGISLDPLAIARNWWLIGVAFLATLAGRAVVVYGAMPFLRGSWAVPHVQLPVVFWGGLRGVVSLALALSIPLALPDGSPFPDRATLQTIAFGVVGASLLLQGLTMRPLIQALGLSSQARISLADEDAAEAEVELLRARRAALDGALLALAHERDHGEIGQLQYQRLATAYEAEQAQNEQSLRSLEARLPEASDGAKDSADSAESAAEEP